MATNYDTLKAALQTLAAEIEDDVRQSKCLIYIDQYIDALEEQSRSVASDVVNYSIAGRSVTRGGQANIQQTVANLEREINTLLYGNATVADFRQSFSTTVVSEDDI